MHQNPSLRKKRSASRQLPHSTDVLPRQTALTAFVTTLRPALGETQRGNTTLPNQGNRIVQDWVQNCNGCTDTHTHRHTNRSQTKPFPSIRHQRKEPSFYRPHQSAINRTITTDSPHTQVSAPQCAQRSNQVSRSWMSPICSHPACWWSQSKRAAQLAKVHNRFLCSNFKQGETLNSLTQAVRGSRPAILLPPPGATLFTDDDSQSAALTCHAEHKTSTTKTLPRRWVVTGSNQRGGHNMARGHIFAFQLPLVLSNSF